ncbi:MAG: hypothetical protein PHH21_03905 [Candidatus Pacebacteria bacterium]|nr:hypothetical protein [Candidatus Paceibacterota bacterium]
MYKSYTSRSTQGKSLVFLYIVATGYMAGVLHKIFYCYDLIIILYITNLLLVITDIVLFYRNSWLENRKQDAEFHCNYPPAGGARPY